MHTMLLCNCNDRSTREKPDIDEAIARGNRDEWKRSWERWKNHQYRNGPKEDEACTSMYTNRVLLLNAISIYRFLSLPWTIFFIRHRFRFSFGFHFAIAIQFDGIFYWSTTFILWAYVMSYVQLKYVCRLRRECHRFFSISTSSYRLATNGDNVYDIDLGEKCTWSKYLFSVFVDTPVFLATPK